MNRIATWTLVLVVIGAAIALVGNRLTAPPPPVAPDEGPLRVSAGRGAGGFALTNRESTAIDQCRISAIDGDREWITAIKGAIQPSETVDAAWQFFTNDRRPMPSYIGVNVSRFSVSCVDVTSAMRRASLVFPQESR